MLSGWLQLTPADYSWLRPIAPKPQLSPPGSCGVSSPGSLGVLQGD